MVAVVGEVGAAVLAQVDRAPNVAVVEPPAEGPGGAARALAEASGREVPYALVAADPLAEVAAAWRAMWEPAAGAREAFEERAGESLLAWRAGRFELPDYYLVVAAQPPGEAPGPHPDDFHLGVLRAERPSRVVAVPGGEPGEVARRVLRALARLPQGPWWPPLDRLVEAARCFFPGAVRA